MSKICPACEKEFIPAPANAGKCNNCGWNSGDVLDEDDPRHIVMMALVIRAKEPKGRPTRYNIFFRVPASAREAAVLVHGDQIKMDGVFWRVTAINPDAVWLRAGRLEFGGNGKSKWVFLRNPFHDNAS